MACSADCIQEWIATVCACRAANITLVVSATSGVYHAYDSYFGDGTSVTDVVTVPTGGSVQVAWVPQPGHDIPGEGCGKLAAFAAVGGATLWNQTPVFSVIPGTEAVWQAPVPDAAGGYRVYPGTVATFGAIGVAT